MERELRYVTFSTDMGWIGILSSAWGLLRTTLPQPSEQEARRLLGAEHAIWYPRLFEDLIQRFRAYFDGRRVTFPDRPDLSGATNFQRRVWEITRLIPYGNTKSYLWVAEQIEKPAAARAVGQALARNPLPIIVPCHRVLTSSGKLGGYGGGIEMKKKLLYLESAATTE
jgi:methylated-DNA-[protein]-cysteine S-methyltransferase